MLIRTAPSMPLSEPLSEHASPPTAEATVPPPAPDALAKQHAALLAFGRRTNARPSMAVLIQDASALVAEVLDADCNGVGEVTAEGSQVAVTIGSVDAKGKVSDVGIYRCSLSAKESMAGYALDAARAVVSTDMAVEKRFHDRFLCKLGVASGLTVPLHVDGKAFGTLGVYNLEKREFTDDDVGFAETIANLVTVSIARERAEETVALQQEFASTILELVNDLVLVLDTNARVLEMNRSCQETTGFSMDAVRNGSFLELFATPREIDSIQQILQTAAREGSPAQFQSSLATKHGEHRQVAWTLRAARVAAEGQRRLVLTGVDHTELLALQRELEQAKAAAQHSTAALRESREVTARADLPDGADEGPQTQPFEAIEAEAAGNEMRSSQRRSYHFRQLIAPMYGGVLPSRDKFFEVPCADISAGGVSFYLDNPPEFQELVVALGQAPSLSYFSARVAHVKETTQDGRQVYMVGCRFTGRLHF